MNRKHMISKGANVLEQMLPSLSPSLRNLISDTMLTEFEREGMLPPLSDQNYDYMDQQDRLAVNQASNWYFLWDDENEIQKK